MKRFLILLIFILSLFSVYTYANDISVTVDGNNVVFADEKPRIVEGRVMVPVRAIFEAIGADVNWDGNSGKITGTKNNDTVIMELNNQNYTVNGYNMVMDSAPIIINSRTFTPARYVAESLGYKVSWNDSLRQVIIEKGSFAKIHFIDVGQGDSCLITSGNSAMVIDGGEEEYGANIVRYIKNLGIDTLDYVVATHPHSDHIGGLDDVINSFNVKNVIMPNAVNTTKAFDNLLTAVENSGANVIEAIPNSKYTLGDTEFTVLAPIYNYEDMNNNSVVIKLSYGTNSVLFTGDAETEAENDILNSGADISADILKIGHHGSATSTSVNFLNTVSPNVAVISVGENNSYGHPSQEVLNRLNNVQTYATKDFGNIVVSLTGNSYNVAYEKAVQHTSEPNNNEITSSYILNTNSKKIHMPNCSAVASMSEKNKEVYNGKLSDLKGYSPCGICNPK